MSSFFKYFALVMQMVPLVGPIVQDVETIKGPKAAGADKKAAVLDIVNQAANATATITPANAAAAQVAQQAASAAIDIAVDFYNKSGLFNHTAGK